MKFRKIISVVAASAIALGTLASCGVKDDTSAVNISKKKAKNYKIGVVQIMEHTSLNTIRDAIVDRLGELGYKDGKNCTIDLQQANGESTTVQQILDKFKDDGSDIIVAITTPCAQLAAPYSEEIPVVFSAVTDPVGAEIVDSIEKTGANITGTSDKLAISKILDFAQELKPEIKKFGYLYNTGEDNSVSCLKEVKEYCKDKDIEVVEAAATNTSEVQEAAQKLADECDAVFSPNDNTIAGAMGTVAEVMNKAKVPMFVGADSMVQDGGLATVGIEYTDLGKETANMVDQILSGKKKASEIPVKVFDEDLSNYVN
ncbi:MAG: ABC transporter substrate-binding protein, partial [Ruminococcus sp.]|nr:ABC transporter substrate-binding protein [Ruminococcus sp.]